MLLTYCCVLSLFTDKFTLNQKINKPLCITMILLWCVLVLPKTPLKVVKSIINIDDNSNYNYYYRNYQGQAHKLLK